MAVIKPAQRMHGVGQIVGNQDAGLHEFLLQLGLYLFHRKGDDQGQAAVTVGLFERIGVVDQVFHATRRELHHDRLEAAPPFRTVLQLF